MTDLLPAADLSRIVNLADFESLAVDRMAGPAYDYVAGGAWDEITLDESTEAWREHRFVPRVLRDVRSIDLSGTFLGRRFPLPIAIAPMAAQAMAHAGAEGEMIAGAAAAGIPFCLSTSSSMTIEEVAAAAPDAVRWFQLYVVGGMAYSRELVQRAEAAGFSALVLTVDLPVLGRRERDQRSGFKLPPMPLVDAADHERERRYGGLEDQRVEGLTWDTLAEIRSWSELPLVIKGVLAPADAALAAEAGAAAIVVSTHGGRQLDRVVSSPAALPGVVDAIAGRCEVWADSGIRRGLDITTAVALGATGVLIGRPFYWALAAGGRRGVERAVDILRAELAIAMPLLGVASFRDLDRTLLA
jgi:4-hydroxymandelate oxidase